MKHPDSPRGLDEYALRLIRSKARQLVGKAGFTASDQEDIEQDLALHLLARLPQFDPRRANGEAFTTQVVQNRVRTLLEHRSAECRDWRRCRASLHDTVALDDGDPIERGDDLDAEAFLRRTGRTDEGDPGHQDLRIDVARAVEHLPPRLQEIAVGLAHGNPTDVARAKGVNRKLVYRAIEQIRACFEAAGLRAYAHPRDSFPRRPVGTSRDARSA